MAFANYQHRRVFMTAAFFPSDRAQSQCLAPYQLLL